MNKESDEFNRVGRLMMGWRTLCIVAAIPYLYTQIRAIGNGEVLGDKWLLAVAFSVSGPMNFWMYRLTKQLHGTLNATLHVIVTILLTPILVIGPLLVPLLVQGDARRLLVIKDQDRSI